MEAKPNDQHGAAAGAKSYNSKSGGILGILEQMLDQFNEDLAQTQKEESHAEASYQGLKAAKQGEIQAASKQQSQSEADLADANDKAAKAKEDKESTSSALEADQEFLTNMTGDCKAEDTAYQ